MKRTPAGAAIVMTKGIWPVGSDNRFTVISEAEKRGFKGYLE